MKLSDFFKKLGINIDEDVDMTEKTTSEENEGVLNEKNGVDDSGGDQPKEEETQSEAKEVQKLKLNYDQKTGLFDLHGIEDEEVKAVLKMANETVKSNANKALIDKAVSDKLGTIKLNKGITNDVVLKMLDLSNVKVADGAVTGLDEAFNNLKTAQSGLFMEDKVNNNSNPLLEGFNPKNVSTQENGKARSIDEAFTMDEI